VEDDVTEGVQIPTRRVVLDSPERARWELAAMAGRLRSLEAKLADEQALTEQLRCERDRERRRLEMLRHSESYRLGYGLVSLAKHPVRTVPRIARAVVRRMRGGRSDGGADVRRAPAAAQRPPAHLYVAIGLDAAAVREFVLTLQQRLLVSPDHRPVVVTDCPSFALLRDMGVLLEYLPDRDTWEKHRPDRAWDEVLAQRLSRLYRDHDTARTIIVDRAAPPTLADLLR
jgi:hypothetical protein